MAQGLGSDSKLYFVFPIVTYFVMGPTNKIIRVSSWKRGPNDNIWYT